MDQQTMRRLVGTARVGRLATVAGDGTPHAVPVCYALHGEIAYSAVDHKPKRHTRLRRITNLEQTRRACLLVDDYFDDWSRLWWVRLDGTGRVVADRAEAEQAVSALVAKYPQYRERRPAGPVLALDITAWRGWSAARNGADRDSAGGNGAGQGGGNPSQRPGGAGSDGAGSPGAPPAA